LGGLGTQNDEVDGISLDCCVKQVRAGFFHNARHSRKTFQARLVALDVVLVYEIEAPASFYQGNGAEDVHTV